LSSTTILQEIHVLFLRNDLLDLLKDMTLTVSGQMCFQRGVASSHYSRRLME